MSEELSVSDVIPASIGAVFSAFLDSDGHSAMTGGKARISDRVGDPFSAWDGYIQGKNLVVEPPGRIVQSWRAMDFPQESDDSRLEILLEQRGTATEVTIVHSNLPDGMGAGFTEGWMKHYFTPMKAYFSAPPPAFVPAKKPRAPKKIETNGVTEHTEEAAPAVKAKPAKKAAKKTAPKKTTSKKAAKKSTPKKAAPKKAAKKAPAKKSASKAKKAPAKKKAAPKKKKAPAKKSASKAKKAAPKKNAKKK